MKVKFWRRRHHIVALAAFLALFNMFSSIVHIDVAMNGMVKKQNITTENGTIITVQEFQWSSNFRSVVISSYFYGAIFTFIIGGWLATRYGGATLLILSTMLSCSVHLATPELTRINDIWVILFRILLGALQGVIIPSINVLWSKWAPVRERSRLASFAMSGGLLGTLITLSASGYIVEYLGWPATFYLAGFISFFCGMIIGKFVKNDPEEDKNVSKKELDHIRCSTGIYDVTIPIPWKTFFTSMPVWAIIVANFCGNWGLITLMNQFPTYLFETSDFGMNVIGILASLPYITYVLMLWIFGKVVDTTYKSRQTRFNETTRRKMFVCGGFTMEMIFISLAGIAHNTVLTIVCIIITTGFEAMAWCAFGVNHLDIASPYAGIITGITYTFSITPGIFSPHLTGLLLGKERKQKQWRFVFFICAFFYLFGAIFYGIFGSADLQEWARRSVIRYTSADCTMMGDFIGPRGVDQQDDTLETDDCPTCPDEDGDSSAEDKTDHKLTSTVNFMRILNL